VIGQWRDRYRVLSGDGPRPPLKIMHGTGPQYRVGPTVDCTGQMPDGRAFQEVNELRSLLAADPERLAVALPSRTVTYATGAEITFADRAEVARIVNKSAAGGYGLRTLLLEVVGSELFNHK